MRMCPNCGEVYDESEYCGCPYCSSELDHDTSEWSKRTYSVSEVANILNVNAETIRRWIRSGKLSARRAMGPGGNTIFLEDIVTFANKPPREYLLPLETWLEANGVNYQKIKDTQDDEKADKSIALKNGSTLTKEEALMASSGVLAASIPLVGPMVAATAITSTLAKRKNHQSYSIQLINSSEESTTKSEVSDTKEMTIDGGREENEDALCPNVFQNAGEENPNISSQGAIDVPVSEAVETTINITDILDKITHAKKMLDAEIITQEEFVEIKARLIAKI